MPFKTMKISIVNPEYNTKIREKLRDEGYDFAALRWDDMVFVRAAYLYTYSSGLVMKGDAWCSEYFKSHPNEEYVLVGDKLKKASDWFKQPATTPTFKDKLDVAVNDIKTDIESAFAAKYLPPDISWKIPLHMVDTDEQLIAKQKAIADKILDKLFPISPFAICAGGAPRDWHFGKPATDLDIFFYSAAPLTGVIEKMLEHVGIKINSVRTSENLPEWYQLNPHLNCVYETTVDGVNVQLMLMRQDTYRSVVPEFPFTICKAWYKDGTIMLDREFQVCEKHKIAVKTGVLYNDKHKYVQKIKAKFPDWQFCDSWEEAYKYAFYSKGGSYEHQLQRNRL